MLLHTKQLQASTVIHSFIVCKAVNGAFKRGSMKKLLILPKSKKELDTLLRAIHFNSVNDYEIKMYGALFYWHFMLVYELGKLLFKQNIAYATTRPSISRER